ncbi:hypothetical protein NDA00_17610 [Funiculus sociatus GB2-M2]|nr:MULTISPECIES: hypothetical protein [unclassified Trichocoleus]
MDIRSLPIVCKLQLASLKKEQPILDCETATPDRQCQQLKRPLTFHKSLVFLGLTAILGLSGGTAPQSAISQTNLVSSIGSNVTFSCNDSEATIRAKNGPRVTFGSSIIYIGYQQVSSINQDPRMVRFDNGVRTWCKTDYDTTGADGRGYGLLWNGSSILYAAFSTDGTQGTSSQDFRRFATNGWLTSYGQGGGRKVAILARIDPKTGNVLNATFLSALLSNGESNSLDVKGLSWTGTNLVIQADSYFAPRRPNKTAMTCIGTSPLQYKAQFTSDLRTVVQASALGCS